MNTINLANSENLVNPVSDETYTSIVLTWTSLWLCVSVVVRNHHRDTEAQRRAQFNAAPGTDA